MKNANTVFRISITLLLSATVFTTSGCVRVPPQAVILSRTVGERLPDIQASHEAFVSAYFEVSRQRVQDFLDERWIPTFLGNFVADSQLMEKLEGVKHFTDQENARLQTKLQGAGISGDEQDKIIKAVNDAFGDPDRGKLVLFFSDSALRQIELKRKALLDPIDTQERATLNELRQNYAQIEQAQSTVTAHLSSIQKVTNEQDQVMARLGLLKSRDEIVNKALAANQEIMSILNSGQDAETTLKQLTDAAKNLGKQ
jgi:hypothetical protein